MSSSTTGRPRNDSSRRTCTTASPVFRPSARATSAGARRRRQSMKRRSSSPALAVVGRQAQEAEARRLLGMGGDEGALALPAHEQVLVGERVDGLAHRALADAEARGELELARDHLARAPFAVLQAAREQRLDLPVERAEGRRPAGAAGAAVVASSSWARWAGQEERAAAAGARVYRRTFMFYIRHQTCGGGRRRAAAVRRGAALGYTRRCARADRPGVRTARLRAAAGLPIRPAGGPARRREPPRLPRSTFPPESP